jgi:hypothetical protein
VGIWWGALTSEERELLNRVLFKKTAQAPHLQAALLRSLAKAEIKTAKEQYLPMLRATLDRQAKESAPIAEGYATLSPGQQMAFRFAWSKMTLSERAFYRDEIVERWKRIEEEDTVDWTGFDERTSTPAAYKQKTIRRMKDKAAQAVLIGAIYTSPQSPLARPTFQSGPKEKVDERLLSYRAHQRTLLDALELLHRGDQGLPTFICVALDWKPLLELEKKALETASEKLWAEEKELRDQSDPVVQRKLKIEQIKKAASERGPGEHIFRTVKAAWDEVGNVAEGMKVLFTEPGTVVRASLSEEGRRAHDEYLEELEADGDRYVGTLIAYAALEGVTEGAVSLQPARFLRATSGARVSNAALTSRYAKLLTEAGSVAEAETAAARLRKLQTMNGLQLDALRGAKAADELVAATAATQKRINDLLELLDHELDAAKAAGRTKVKINPESIPDVQPALVAKVRSSSQLVLTDVVGEGAQNRVFRHPTNPELAVRVPKRTEDFENLFANYESAAKVGLAKNAPTKVEVVIGDEVATGFTTDFVAGTPLNKLKASEVPKAAVDSFAAEIQKAHNKGFLMDDFKLDAFVLSSDGKSIRLVDFGHCKFHTDGFRSHNMAAKLINDRNAKTPQFKFQPHPYFPDQPDKSGWGGLWKKIGRQYSKGASRAGGLMTKRPVLGF